MLHPYSVKFASYFIINNPIDILEDIIRDDFLQVHKKSFYEENTFIEMTESS